MAVQHDFSIDGSSANSNRARQEHKGTNQTKGGVFRVLDPVLYGFASLEFSDIAMER